MVLSATSMESETLGSFGRVVTPIQTTERLNGVITVSEGGRYTELASGLLHRENNDEWSESSSSASTDGKGAVFFENRAIALEFAPNLNSTEVLKQTLKGQKIGSAIAAIGYLNTLTDQMTLIAHPQNSTGVAVEEGVFYSHAFDAIDADVQYKVHPWGIEQDVLMYGGLPQALNPDHTRLCVLTEFVGLTGKNLGVEREGETQPAEADSASLELFKQDGDGWYRLYNFHRSYAFPVTGNGWSVGGKAQNGQRIPLKLRLVDIQGKLYLSEELPLTHLLSQAPHVFTSSILNEESASLADLNIPSRPIESDVQLAKTDLGRRATPYVIDYIDYSGSETNDLRLSSGQTYYISSDLVMDGATLTVEPGAVIKLQTNASVKLLSGSVLMTESHARSNAVFTSAHNNSIGETITGSTGGPETNRVATSLILEAGDQVLDGLIFSYFDTALEFSALTGALDLKDSQFFEGGRSISIEEGSEGVTLRNLLFEQVEEGIIAITNDLTLQSLTFSGVTNDAVSVTTGVSQVSLKSSIFNSVGTGLSSNGHVTVVTDHNAALTGTSGPLGADLVSFSSSPFVSGSEGDYYISNTNLIDAGHTNAHLLGLYHYSTQTDHSPEATNIVDIGFHYTSDDDADSDGLYDYEEDTNGDGNTDAGETDINDADSDSDGLEDGEEVHTYFTDPLDTDTDDDGMSDQDEVTQGTDPLDGASYVTSISGATTYSGEQTGTVTITASSVHIPTDGLLFRYSMDSDEGGALADSSGNGNDGSAVNGALWVSNAVNNTGGYSLDGINDYLSAGGWGSMETGSVSFWVFSDIVQSPRHAFSTDYASWDDCIHVLEGYPGASDLIISGLGISSNIILTSSLSSGVWHHVAFTWTKTTISGYFNGDLKGVATHSGVYPPGLNLNINHLVLGNSYSTHSSRYWKGDFDEFLLYDTELTTDDVANLHLWGTDLISRSTTTPAPGAYSITNLPTLRDYEILAWMDHDGDGIQDSIEPVGTYSNQPLTLLAAASNVDIPLSDPDSDGDGDGDWSEMTYGSDPTDSNSFLVSISGTIDYDGYQPGDIIVQAVKDDGEALHFTFDSDQGSVFTDETGNYNATNSGAIHTTNGYLDGAMYFSNASYMTVGDVLDLTSNGDRLSVSCWFNSASNYHNGFVIGKNQLPWPYTGWGLQEIGDNAFVDLIASYPQRAWYHDEPSVDDSTWHHWAGIFRRDATGLETELFIDGESTGEASWSGTPSATDTSQPLMIGCRDSSGGWAITGTVDEVWIFEHELSASEISALYVTNSTAPMIYQSTLSATGSYTIAHVPNLHSYTVSAWKDMNINLQADVYEAQGSYESNDLYLATTETNINISLSDVDSDGDTVPDWWEEEYGYDYSVDVTNGLVLWMPLDETSGTNVTDISGNSFNGGLMNSPSPRWTNGVMDGALDLYEAKDMITVAYDSLFNQRTNLSMSAWVKHSTTSNWQYVISRYGGSTLYSGYINYMGSDAPGRSPNYVTGSNTTVVAGEWSHLVATHAESNLSTYVDGILVGSRTTTNVTTSSVNDLTIGGENIFNFFQTFSLDGVLDDVRFYSSTLSSNAVASLAELGADDDGDGISNFNEFLNRTDPTVNDASPPIVTITKPETTIYWVP